MTVDRQAFMRTLHGRRAKIVGVSDDDAALDAPERYTERVSARHRHATRRQLLLHTNGIIKSGHAHAHDRFDSQNKRGLILISRA